MFERMPRDLFEVILVDGNSTDGTVDVARDLWPSVVAIKQTGKGKGNTCWPAVFGPQEGTSS